MFTVCQPVSETDVFMDARLIYRKHSNVLQILEKSGSPLLNITETICGVPTSLKYSWPTPEHRDPHPKQSLPKCN